MRTTLIALSVGATMLGGAGIVQADTMADPATPVGQTAGQSEVAMTGQVRAPELVVLTDSQMEKLTAGHLYNGSQNHKPWRNGWFWVKYGGGCQKVYGKHGKGSYC